MKLASRAVVGSVAALSLVIAIAEETAPRNADVRHVIALADGPRGSVADALDAYAGRYAGPGNITLLVDRDDDALTIELPAQLGGAVMRLEAAATPNTFTAAGSLHVVFTSGANGQVLALSLYAPNNDALVANKMPVRRGVVTIQDLSGGADYTSSSLETAVRAY